MNRNDRILVIALAFSIVLPATAFAVNKRDEPPAPVDSPQRPPNPDIDLGDWDKPSKPIWMPTEIQEPTPKVQAVNRSYCSSKFARQVISNDFCRADVKVEFDVSSEGHTENIRVIDSRPEGAMLKNLAMEYAQCLQFPIERADEPPNFRKSVWSRISFEKSPGREC